MILASSRNAKSALAQAAASGAMRPAHFPSDSTSFRLKSFFSSFSAPVRQRM